MSQLSIYIDQKLASSSHTVSIKPYIFRVDELLHKENKRAYEPELLAIGPYHRNKDHLKMMEGHKLRYLQEFLERREERSVGRYVDALGGLEEKARKCYADPIELDRDQFVEMMLFDGIFIMELLRNFNSSMPWEMDILESDRIQKILVRDLLLFENQLPLFVLTCLSGMANEPDFSVEDTFGTYIQHRKTWFICSKKFIGPPTEVNLHHLLGVIRYAMRPKLLDHIGYVSYNTSKFNRSATELQDAGIKFQVDLESDSLMDIDFENGIMKISNVIIDDNTEQLLRNVIAYEQYNDENRSNRSMYVTGCVKFMIILIKSPNDVKILRQSKIFKIRKGMDDESIFSMFQKLRGVVFQRDFWSCYAHLSDQIEYHCDQRWNIRKAKWRHRRRIWMAKLKQDYFNSPWSVLSLIGVFVLLVLTAIQTVCSILQV